VRTRKEVKPMKKKDMNVLIEGLRKLSQDVADIANVLEGTAEPKKKEEASEPEPAEEMTAAPEPQDNSVTETAPEKVWTKEEVRLILAEKARSGYRAEVKALLTAHGAKQLSDITEPAVFAAIAAEAEGIGNG
jgi:hypothetical protein